MSVKVLLRLFFSVFLFASCSKNQISVEEINIIPKPQKLEKKAGQFVLNEMPIIKFEEGFNEAVNALKDILSHVFPGKKNEENQSKVISFIKDSSIEKEGYQLSITTKEIVIKASSEEGAFYAVQSFRQILPPYFEKERSESLAIVLPCVEIEDSPRFSYRGMHLDVSRHMFPVEFIKKYIDILAMMKMNTFHWHLTDDQGWRIEIKKYPKLNSISSFRKETLIGHYNDTPQTYDGEKYGGYYRQDEIKEIVEYAKKKQITIIPEIEMPGHSTAVIAAYPELGCSGKQIDVAKKWGVFDDVFCPNDSTFIFLQNVLDEVMDLFPSEVIHIGGDEAPKTQWESSAFCQDLIRKEGLIDEHGLQSYFITRIEKYVNSKGRKIIGWDEILEGGLAPNAMLMSWRGMNGGIEAAKSKHEVVMSPTSHCYFDYYQSVHKDEPLAIGGYLPLEKVYAFDPVPEGLSEEEEQYIIGAQGNLWTEYMKDEDKVEYMIFPRILAMSEVVWSNKDARDYADFVERVEHFNQRLSVLDINYANHLYEISGELTAEEHDMKYHLSTLTKGKVIRYTLDGSSPDLNSESYDSPIAIQENALIKAAVFDSKIQLGREFTQEILVHKAMGSKISLNIEPHKSYTGSGKKGLINGIKGSDSRYGDKEWLGFWGEDLIIDIDLQNSTEIETIRTRLYNANGQWIYAPKQIMVSFDDGAFQTFEVDESDDLIKDVKLEFSGIEAKMIRLKVPNFGFIPKGFQGAGNKAWTFIDEIIIE